MKPIASSFAAACSVLLGACASAPSPAPAQAVVAPAGSAPEAVANLAAASGSLVSGRLVLAPMGDGVHITGTIGGLTPGSQHGFHIHETGDCSAMDASSAGGHFNPDAQPHGRAGHGAHHAGDADNLAADGNGVARVDVHLSGVSLGTGAANDIAGRAIVVHVAPDDYRSQPAGNAGARIACGVIRVTR
ncbi:superoxide dismutase family protein [Thermomonas alba]|uniref:superoxide dismutase family protein n=1 Tax=Thermomonas alba TaxID=2888525 RepID=UPI001F03BED6|nr:superoxide dismutase family protein [Thermomonas alba]